MHHVGCFGFRRVLTVIERARARGRGRGRGRGGGIGRRRAMGGEGGLMVPLQGRYGDGWQHPYTQQSISHAFRGHASCRREFGISDINFVEQTPVGLRF
jgi:hypothetical protein